MVSHDERLVSSGSRLSLAERLCGGDIMLDSSTSQAHSLRLVRSYLPDLDPSVSDSAHTYFPGWAMCLLALCIWFLTVAAEFSSALDVTKAFWHLLYDGENLGKAPE